MKMPRAKSGPVNRRAAHAALAMRVADYYTQGKRSYFRLHEKGGKYLVIPAHHMAQAWTDEYIERAGLAADPKGPLFPSAGTQRGSGRLSSRPIKRTDALKMIIWNIKS